MIESLKDLEKLLKLCRKQGVVKIELGSTKLELGSLPSEGGSMDESQIENPFIDPFKDFPQGVLTPDQQTHYAMGGTPEEDPVLKVG